MTDTKDEVRFWVAKYLVKDKLNNRRGYFDYQSALDRLRDPDLDDARCLVRMIKKEVDAHNAAINTKLTLVDNLRYTSKWRDSKFFSGKDIPWKQIDKLIEEHPDWDYFKIYTELRDKNL